MNDAPAPPSKLAAPDLLVLARWEDAAAWLIEHAARWPKSHRFTFAQRVQNLALDILDRLVQARYAPARRQEALAAVNGDLARLRHLLRMAEKLRVMPSRSFETAMRHVDETGRMAYGWRTGRRGGSPAQEVSP